MKRFFLLIPFITTIFITTARAQDKYYVWTAPYETTDANEFELESYSYFLTPSLSDNTHSLVQEFELEYGVTDRLQLGMYQVFNRDYPAGSGEASFMIEALYKLAGRDRWIVNPLLYLEYERPWDFKSPNHLEAKLVLSKDIGRLNGTVNGIGEFEFGGKSDFSPELSAGASYLVADGLRAGVEGFFTLSDEDKSADEDFSGSGVGPTVSVSTPWFDITSGVLIGTSRGANALNFCTNIDFEL